MTINLSMFNIVTQEQAVNSILILGIQFGFMGYILRLGLYKQKDKPVQEIK